MLDKLLTLVARFLPERRIIIDGEIYLRRYYLWGRMPDDLADLWNCGTRPRQRLGFLRTAYLHRFEKPDADRDCHNHPWSGRSLILVGGYIEDRWTAHPSKPGAQLVRVERRPLTRMRLEPDTFHRIDSLRAPVVWTLFRIGPKVQGWGYWDARTEQFVPWRDRHADANVDIRSQRERSLERPRATRPPRRTVRAGMLGSGSGARV